MRNSLLPSPPVQPNWSALSALAAAEPPTFRVKASPTFFPFPLFPSLWGERNIPEALGPLETERLERLDALGVVGSSDWRFWALEALGVALGAGWRAWQLRERAGRGHGSVAPFSEGGGGKREGSQRCELGGLDGEAKATLALTVGVVVCKRDGGH